MADEWIPAPDWGAGEWVKDGYQMPTVHLPDDVVGSVFSLTVENWSVKGSPRDGATYYRLNFDGQDLPRSLTGQQKAFVLGIVQGVLDQIDEPRQTSG